jgi:PAS domain S-box-containing protein
VLNLVIVGAGKGGAKLIESLKEHPEILIRCVVDINPKAPGMELARQLSIATETDYREVVPSYRGEQIDVVLEVTGSLAIYDELRALAANHSIVISGVALKFFMLLIEDKLTLISELKARQRELELILDATHDGMIGVNADGVLTLFNRTAARITGMDSKDALGRTIDDVFPLAPLMDVLKTGRAELNQREMLGQTEIVISSVPVIDEQGAVVGGLAVFRDVTELKHLGEEITNLREIQTLLEAIIQSTQDAISVVDKDGKGLLINPAYTRLTGLRPEDVIGKPADVDIAEGDSMHLRVLKTQKPVKNVPMKVGPHRREVIVDVAPMLVGGELRGSVGVIHDVSEIKRLTEELEKANKLIRRMQAKYTFEDIVGNSPAMVLAIEQAKRAAQTPATVLLRGESGTGKELFAHAIHNDSDRRYHPFVRVNCAALSETLLESELFGYEEGAFTGAKRGGKRGLFEEASGGTLFLDEIGEMSVSTQAKLLRALQEQEIVRVGGTKPISVNVRVIAATHVNLEQAVAKGKFREDLYYRLNVIPIVIPPLRYRKQDIAAIAKQIVARHNEAYGRHVERLSDNAVALLEEYDWPGNVRELENTIGRAMINMAYTETVLEAHHLPVLNTSPRLEGAAFDVEEGVQELPGSLNDIVKAAERNAILQALRLTGGNKTEAAKRLGISIRSLYYKMEQVGIEN